MWLIALIVGGTLFLAYANGANDNFKGVATLLGGGVADYRTALRWATVTTVLGSLCSVFWASELVTLFTGAGLVPEELIGAPEFMAAVILGAGLTVFAAALVGMPISTTHSLTGALIGSALASLGGGINLEVLGENFLYPLGLSPLIAVALAGLLYPLAARLAPLCRRLDQGMRFRLEHAFASVPAFAPWNAFAAEDRPAPASKKEPAPAQAASGRRSSSAVNALHFLSAGAVCFARALNDTPKIVAILLAAHALDIHFGVLLIALPMAAGGLVQARKIARTMSFRITPLSHGQGAFANLITSGLVIFASRWGVPLSTTHVSCGSLFGLGLARGSLNWGVFGGIFSAWVLTLPVALAIAYLAHTILAALG